MKFSKSRQLYLVSSIGLLVAALLTACSITTIDYVFVAGTASSGNGQIQTFAADSESGALRIVAAAVSTGGVKPVAMTVTADFANLYVANQDNKSIVHFTIGMNGQLTSKDTITAASTPVSIAVNTAGTYLYVVSGPHPSVLTAYSLSSGTIGSVASQQTLSLYGSFVSFSGDLIVPTGVTVLTNNETVQGNAVYVSAYDQSAYNPGGATTSNANPGWVFGYTIGSAGSLTPAPNPYQAGVRPSALIADPTDRFLYVTDYASNQLIGYAIQGGNNLSFLTNGPFKTGNEPAAITIDPTGKFIYVTNALDSTVSAYEITLSTGTPTVATGSTGTVLNATDTEPVAIAIDPALGRFVYTANELGNSVSGFRLDPTAGSLTNTEATPYPTLNSESPVAIVVIPHGNHATQSVTP